MTAEHAVRFGPIGGVRIGVVHIPVGPPRQAVLIPASGGQTRVGVGRVFVSLARAMAEAGFAVMRFDTRGTGDSDGVPGTPRAAEHLSPEIAAALEEFERRLPAGTPFVLCGLCGGASAVLTYAPTDRRVAGVVLLNPWVPGGDLDHWVELGSYYLRRLSDPDLWARLKGGRFNMQAAVRSVLVELRQTIGPFAESPQSADSLEAAGERIERGMIQALESFQGRILVVLSGKDVTRTHYATKIAQSMRWQTPLHSGRAVRIDIPEADATFSRRASDRA